MDATTVTLQVTTEEAIYLEACLARRRELLALADAAPHGHVLARCEAATVEIARQHAHQLLNDAITHRVADAEKKGIQPGSVRAVGCDTAGGPTTAPS